MRRLCIASPFQRGGGAEYQIACLIDVLSTLGRYEIHFLAHNHDSSGRHDGYALVPVGRNGRIPRLGYISDAWPLYRALRAVRPDVIYQRVAGGYTAICAHYARRHHRPMIWHVSSDSDVLKDTGFYGRNPLRRLAERWAIDYGARHATHIVTQTQSQAKYLQDSHGRSVAAIIPNFHPQPDERPDKSGPLTVLWIANLKPLKRPEVFVQLASALADCAGVSFVMIGAMQFGGVVQAQGARLAQAIDAATNLRYLGPLPQHEVNHWLAQSHLLVSTSYQEGFPNTFIQAWMREVPVVSLRVNPDNVMNPESTGVCVDTDSELASAVRRLLAEPARLRRMGAGARDYALRQHSLANARRLVELLDRD